MCNKHFFFILRRKISLRIEKLKMKIKYYFLKVKTTLFASMLAIYEV
jgi:hypothetical protein